MHIIADDTIPFAERAFRMLGSVRCIPAGSMNRESVRNADVLLVRSVTRVDATLLEGSAVRFVGSATAGADHIDTEYLHRCGIGWTTAPGANADAVVEYVLAALLRLAVCRGTTLAGKTLGIVGCGHVGSGLSRRAGALGMSVLCCDPPLAEVAAAAGEAHEYLPLRAVIDRADVITLHVPLTRKGPHPTRHMIGRDELEAMRPGAWLVNTARGAVVDSGALLEAMERSGKCPDSRHPGAVVLDVWEDEPHPCAQLVRRVDIATPHIAGHSLDGRLSGTRMLFDVLAASLGMDSPPIGDLPATETLRAGPPDPVLPPTDWLHHLVRRMYDVARDDRRMRRVWPDTPEAVARHFAELRRTGPERRSFAAWHLEEGCIPPVLRGAVREGLGVRSGPIPRK